MNKIFKVVYNKATGRYEVVSELAKAEGKASSSTLQNKSIFSKQVSRLTMLSLCLASVGFAAAADNAEVIGYTHVNSQGAESVKVDRLTDQKPWESQFDENKGKYDEGKGAKGERSIASGIYANALAKDSIAIGSLANVNNNWGGRLFRENALLQLVVRQQ